MALRVAPPVPPVPETEVNPPPPVEEPCPPDEQGEASPVPQSLHEEEEGHGYAAVIELADDAGVVVDTAHVQTAHDDSASVTAAPAKKSQKKKKKKSSHQADVDEVVQAAPVVGMTRYESDMAEFVALGVLTPEAAAIPLHTTEYFFRGYHLLPNLVRPELLERFDKHGM